jgi:hypothetical protein
MSIRCRTLKPFADHRELHREDIDEKTAAHASSSSTRTLKKRNTRSFTTKHTDCNPTVCLTTAMGSASRCRPRISKLRRTWSSSEGIGIAESPQFEFEGYVSRRDSFKTLKRTIMSKEDNDREDDGTQGWQRLLPEAHSIPSGRRPRPRKPSLLKRTSNFTTKHRGWSLIICPNTAIRLLSKGRHNYDSYSRPEFDRVTIHESRQRCGVCTRRINADLYRTSIFDSGDVF